jgi:hypothetical protein
MGRSRGLRNMWGAAIWWFGTNQKGQNGEESCSSNNNLERRAVRQGRKGQSDKGCEGRKAVHWTKPKLIMLAGLLAVLMIPQG